MIRKFTTDDLDDIVSIWLNASIIAHDFIPVAYWQDHAEDMRNIYIPSAETFVYAPAEGGISGFLSLMDNHIAAIFVDPAQQGRGIGKQLMNRVKALHSSLTLCVYKKNTNSVRFYTGQGFSVKDERKEANTGETEYFMEWTAPKK